jgi:hypothetical protein
MLSFFTWWVISNSNIQHSLDLSCKNLGFDKYTYNTQDFCQDYQDNLHFIKTYGCNFWGNNCQAKKITIGEVEVAPK